MEKFVLIGIVMGIPVFTYATSLNGILAITKAYCKNKEGT